MVTLQEVIPLLQEGDFMAALDLKDMYFHIPIHPAHRRVPQVHGKWKTLPVQSAAFRGNHRIQGVHEMPGGGRRSPPERRGIHVFTYLDDWLIKSASHQQFLTQ